MDGIKRWRDTEHLRRAVESAGGQEEFDAAYGRMLEELGAVDRVQDSRCGYVYWGSLRCEQVRRAGGEEAVAAGKAELLGLDDGDVAGIG